MAKTTVRCLIHGRVQGVWYRAWTERTATEMGLDGWVRNRRDGSVEALFHGDEDTVQRMIDACREGPPSARVTEIEAFDAEAPAEPGFRVTG